MFSLRRILGAFCHGCEFILLQSAQKFRCLSTLSELFQNFFTLFIPSARFRRHPCEEKFQNYINTIDFLLLSTVKIQIYS
jgi:hypothetical protein